MCFALFACSLCFNCNFILNCSIIKNQNIFSILIHFTRFTNRVDKINSTFRWENDPGNILSPVFLRKNKTIHAKTQPINYSKAPHISKSFVPQKELPEKSWYVTESYVSSSNAASVQNVAQIHGHLQSSGEVTPLPKRCRILNYFKTFMDDIESLEATIERNSEIKIETFQSAYEREKRDIFQKQMLPIVKHLRLCASLWELELQNEVKTMKDVFKENENAILAQKHRNRILKK
jgi:hypothetical protein